MTDEMLAGRFGEPKHCIWLEELVLRRRRRRQAASHMKAAGAAKQWTKLSFQLEEASKGSNCP